MTFAAYIYANACTAIMACYLTIYTKIANHNNHAIKKTWIRHLKRHIFFEYCNFTCKLNATNVLRK